MSEPSHHAAVRAAQRRVAPEHIEFARAWGSKIRQPGGRVAHHVGRRDVERARSAGATIPDRVAGVTVVISPDRGVITVIRSADRHRLTVSGRRRRRRT